MAVPNKTIYVSDGDLKLYQRAQELAGGNLSAAIAGALRRYVDVQEGLREGFDDVRRPGRVGFGRKVRFTGALVGEWLDSRSKTARPLPRLARPRGQVRRPHGASRRVGGSVDAEGKPAGWRGWIGRRGRPLRKLPKESTIEVVPTLEELREKVPTELFEMVRGRPANRRWKSSTSEPRRPARVPGGA